MVIRRIQVENKQAKVTRKALMMFYLLLVAEENKWMRRSLTGFL